MQNVRIHFRLNADNPQEAAIIDWLMNATGENGRLRIKKTIVPVLEQEARKQKRRKARKSTKRTAVNGADRGDQPRNEPDIDFEDLPPENDEEASEAPMQNLYFGSP